MDYDTVPKFAIAISVVAVIVAAAAMVVVFTDDDGMQDRYRIYVGMDENATQDDMDAVESHMKDLISSEYGTGYTMYWADGAYVGPDGAVVENNTLVIILLDVSGSQVDSIVSDAMDLDGVDSVVKEKYRSDFVLN